MLNLLRRIVPRSMRQRYHRFVATLAMVRFGRPSRKMTVIGVTGTDGKTTTTNLIAHVLSSAGRTTGLSSSAMFQVGSKRWPNESHLTMPGRFSLQRLLRQMVDAGCTHAVLEVSSEGLAQYRHIGIDFDTAVITNLTPEHIESHGSFEKYRHAKELLFGQIIKGGDKHLGGRIIRKVTVVNLDDAHAERFLKFWAEEHYGVTVDHPHVVPAKVEDKLKVLKAENISMADGSSSFAVDGRTITLPLPGRYNISNALEAAAVCLAAGLTWEEIAKGLASFSGVPGRTQEIPTNKPWRVVIDYALTPNALEQLYLSIEQSGSRGIIGVFGAAGGGRDAWKRPELGKIAAQHCRHILLTTDDPYSEDPEKIAHDILQGISKDQQTKVEIVLDRRAAIARAVALAQPGDVIAITGMGSETSMMVKGQKVPWSDIDETRAILKI